MQKLLHRIILFSVLLFSFAIMPQTAFSQNENLQAQEQVQVVQDESEFVLDEQTPTDVDALNEEMGLGEQRAIVIDDVESSVNDNELLTEKVVPDTMVELKKMVKMFLKVMLGVLISTIIIFILLLFVRRFYAPQVTLNSLNYDGDSKEGLDTPTNKSDALKTFLDKTKNV